MSMGMCFFFLFFFTSQFMNKIQKQSQNLTPTPTSFSQVKQKNCPKSCCSVTAGNVEVKFLIWDASSFVLQYWNSGRSHFRHGQPVLVWPIEQFLPYFLSFGNLILQVSNTIVRGRLENYEPVLFVFSNCFRKRTWCHYWPCVALGHFQGIHNYYVNRKSLIFKNIQQTVF